jgi:hypothetical protein
MLLPHWSSLPGHSMKGAHTMTLYTTYLTAAFLGTSILLVGCGGSSPTPSMGGLSAPSGTAQTRSLLPQDHQGCQNDGDINVMPCRVRFDANNPGPVNVRVSSGDRRDNHAIKERDDCASRGVATITKVTDRHYMVAAGTSMGSCTAHFDTINHNDDGNNGNGSDLRVVNEI